MGGGIHAVWLAFMGGGGAAVVTAGYGVLMAQSYGPDMWGSSVEDIASAEALYASCVGPEMFAESADEYASS